MRLKWGCTLCGAKHWFGHYFYIIPTEYRELLPHATDDNFHTCRKCYKRLKPWLRKRTEQDKKTHANERQKLLTEQKEFLRKSKGYKATKVLGMRLEGNELAFRVLKWPIAAMVWSAGAFVGAAANLPKAGEIFTFNHGMAGGLTGMFLACWAASAVWFFVRFNLFHTGLIRIYYSRLREDLRAPRKAQRELRKKWQAADKWEDKK